MADDEGIIEVNRVREVTGIGTPYVFPKNRITKKKKSPAPEEEAYIEETDEEESHRSDKGIDIKA